VDLVCVPAMIPLDRFLYGIATQDFRSPQLVTSCIARFYTYDSSSSAIDSRSSTILATARIEGRTTNMRILDIQLTGISKLQSVLNIHTHVPIYINISGETRVVRLPNRQGRFIVQTHACSRNIDDSPWKLSLLILLLWLFFVMLPHMRFAIAI